MSETTKLIALATANLGKTPEQKAIEQLKDQVEANEMAFKNDEFAAKNAVKAANKHLASLNANPSARAKDIMEARYAVKVAESEVSAIAEIMAARF